MTIRILDVKKYIQLPVTQIERIEGDCNYSTIYTEAKVHKVARTMKRITADVATTMVQIHRRYTVNPAYVIAVTRFADGWRVFLRSGAVLPVSRRKVKVVDTLLAYLKTVH